MNKENLVGRIKIVMGDPLYEIFEQQIKARLKEKMPMYHGSKYCENYQAKHFGDCAECDGSDGCDAKDYCIIQLYLLKQNKEVPDIEIITGEFVEKQSKDIERIADFIIKESEKKDPLTYERFKKLKINQ